MEDPVSGPSTSVPSSGPSSAPDLPEALGERKEGKSLSTLNSKEEIEMVSLLLQPIWLVIAVERRGEKKKRHVRIFYFYF